MHLRARFRAGIAMVLAAGAGWAQTPTGSGTPSAQMQAPDVNKSCVRLEQLMDAGGVAIPSLRAASQPLIANLHAACHELQLRPATGQPTYDVLQNVRAYLELADVVPKPYPFPDVARDQLRELRDSMTRFDAHFRAVLDQKDTDARSPDRDSSLRFQEENSRLPAPAANGRRVVFLGDSIFSQWRVNEYFPKEDFLNRSINGQLSGQLLTRMKADVIDLKPKAVVIEAGSFDIQRGVPLALIANNLTMMAELAAASNIKVVFASVPPVNDYLKAENPTYERTPTRPRAAIVALNNWIKTFARDRRLGFVDFDTVLADGQDMLQREATDDGLHPNARGYRVMAPLLAQELERVLRPVPVRAPTPPAAPPVTTPPSNGAKRGSGK